MHYSVVFSKLWSALILVGIILLSGCPSAPVIEPEPQIPPPVSDIDTTTYHFVQRGETLYGIAQRYGRDYKALAHWNNIMPPYALNVGQSLRIDGPGDSMITPSMPQDSGIPETFPPPAPQSPEPSSEEGVHTVQAGETLFAIARNYELNVSDVAAWNNIEPPYHLSIGQRLIVSPSGNDDFLMGEPPIPDPIGATPPVGVDRDYHLVLKGDTLYNIAKHYGFSVTDIAAWNGLQQPYILSLGQKLRVSPPSADTILPSPRPSTPSYESPNPSYPSPDISDDEDESLDYHTVAAKETLYSISRQYGYSVQEIAKWNYLETPYFLSIGQKLRVTPPTTMMPDATPDSRYFQRVKLPSPANNYHTVKPGETLTSIAKKYRVSYLDLADWNGIGNPFTVYPGQKLTLIPH
jgi:peptidoglycan endopeptidase LytF